MAENNQFLIDFHWKSPSQSITFKVRDEKEEEEWLAVICDDEVWEKQSIRVCFRFKFETFNQTVAEESCKTKLAWTS